MHFQMEHMCIRVTGGKQFGLRVGSYSTRAMIYTLESDQSWIQDCQCWKSNYSPIIYRYQLIKHLNMDHSGCLLRKLKYQLEHLQPTAMQLFASAP